MALTSPSREMSVKLVSFSFFPHNSPSIFPSQGDLRVALTASQLTQIIRVQLQQLTLVATGVT